MSVVKSKRSESSLEFIYKARELQRYTIQKCIHFPKRYTFYLAQPIVDMATHIHECVKKANSIFPTNAHEAQTRIDYLLEAHATLQAFVSQIEVSNEIFGFEPNVMDYWMGLVDTEIRLVKGVLKKDRERFKMIQ